MRNYLKNKNEYIEDGKRYIEDIDQIYNLMKLGDKYTFCCCIHQRGIKLYQYVKDSKYIERTDCSGKKLWLDSAAMQKVEETIAAFDEAVDEAVNGGGYTEVWLEGLDGFVYYRRITSGMPFSRRRFDIVKVFPDESGETVKLFSEDCSVSAMIRQIENDTVLFGKETLEAEKAIDYICHSDNKTIAFNPLYLSALKENDKMMQCELKLHYGIADEDECRFLSEKTGLRILPLLPKDYDKSYVVEAIDENENSEFLELLHHSGYKILHRPYFAMMNSTHKNISLNPHTKTGVDAAEQDAEAITFDEFLALFDEYEKSKLQLTNR